MKIKLGYSMGYAGTDSEWEEEIPEDIVKAGEEAIDAYFNEALDGVHLMACEQISTWGKIVK